MQMTESEFGKFWRQWYWVFVKGWHVLEFATLTFLAAFSFERLGWANQKRVLAWSAGVGILFACSDEIHQIFVPKRGGRMSDVLIDCGGVLIGLVLARLYLLKRDRKRLTLAEAKRT